MTIPKEEKAMSIHLIHIILDRSGSMECLTSAPVGQMELIA